MPVRDPSGRSADHGRGLLADQPLVRWPQYRDTDLAVADLPSVTECTRLTPGEFISVLGQDETYRM